MNLNCPYNFPDCPICSQKKEITPMATPVLNVEKADTIADLDIIITAAQNRIKELAAERPNLALGQVWSTGSYCVVLSFMGYGYLVGLRITEDVWTPASGKPIVLPYSDENGVIVGKTTTLQTGTAAPAGLKVFLGMAPRK